MQSHRIVISGLAAAALVVAVLWQQRHETGGPVPAAVPPSHPAGVARHADVPPAADPIADVTPAAAATAAVRTVPAAVQRFTLAHGWSGTLPPALTAFRAWTVRFGQASTAAARDALVTEGLALAQARRPVMRSLLETNPQLALAATVPAAVRAALPAAIVHELEERFSTRGNFIALVFEYSPAEAARRRAQGLRADPFQFAVEIDGREYPAFVYGRRRQQTTKQALPLHGIRLDGAVALADTALRVLERDEPVAAEIDGVIFAETAGRVLGFASAAEVERAEARLEAAEAGLGPELRVIPDDMVPNPSARPATAEPSTLGSPTTAWTIGNKNILVIRVDFSDLPGEPRRGSTTYTADYVQNLANTQVAPYYVQSSYGQTSHTYTVTPVYRMPQTATSYATAGANTQLHTDARTAAGANYTVDSYDRILVLFTSLSGISGSTITYGGLAQVGGKNSWINGAWDFRVVAHEIGHTYGLRHANLWLVTDGNPVSAAGANQEYGDDFDTMGANFANDQRTDFNPWFKNVLGWARDDQIRTVTASGTYRINRFDNATGTGTLALAFPRDSTRTYWIGARRNFTTNTLMQHGAYVIWGYNTSSGGNGYLTATGSHLLDLNTPGTSVTDAALGLNNTLMDVDGNVSIRAAAEGGTAPDQYLDVQVTLGLNGVPVIATQPQSQGYALGATVSLSVAVTGTAPFTYQWRKNGADIPGATNATLTITNAQTGDAGSYTVRVANAIATVMSSAAVIAPNGSPVILAPPTNFSTAAGRSVSLTVSCSGSPAPTFQWRKNGGTIAGATNATFAIASATAGDSGQYDVVLTNAFGTVTSDAATVTVNAATTPPSNDNFANAWVLPGNAGVATGTNSGATGEAGEPLHVITNGTATSVWYRWTPAVSGTAQVDTIGSTFDTVLAVYTGNTVSGLTKVGEDDQSGGINTSKLIFPVTAGTTYAIAVGDFSSTRLGGTIALAYGVFTPPVITTQPSNQVANLGGTATFAASVPGTTSRQQWFRNGVLLPGATSATLNLSNLTAADAGSYYFVAANIAGVAKSTVVTLSSSNAAPSIVTPPADLAATAGQSPTLTVSATGTAPLAYQWRRNGFPITGATGASLTLPSITRTDADLYDVLVTSGLSLTTSPAARVTVAPGSYPGLVAPDPAWELRPEATSGGLFGYAIVPLADGRAYVGGSFVSLDGTRRAGIARVNADGTLDTTFLPPEIDNAIRAMVVQPDGKVVVAGDFVRVNGLLRSRIARLNPDGSVDGSFNIAGGASATVYALALQSDGKIIAGGNFIGFAGTPRDRLVRLLADGSVDPNFANHGFTSTVFALAVQTDGRVVVGGSFSSGFIDVSGNTVSRSRLARILADGSLDTAYNPAPNSTVNALALQSDGRLVVGGSFTSIAGTSQNDIARLNADGTIDTGFAANIGTGFNGSVNCLAVQSNGQILVGGNFGSFAGVATASYFARLNANGTRDTTFATYGFNGSVTSTGVLPNGQIIAGGGFTYYYTASGVGTLRVRFARLNGDGTLDTGVNFSPRVAGSINGILPLTGGKLLVTGFFSTLRGSSVPVGVARLNPDGTVDTTFNVGGAGATANVYAVAAYPTGEVVLVGAFTTFNGAIVNGIVRLRADGARDTSFDAGLGITGGYAYTATVLPGGRILIGGTFTGVGGITRNRLAVLQPNGALDTTFDPGLGPSAVVWSSAAQPDGKVVIGGQFTAYNGTSSGRIARVLATGAADPTFSAPVGANSDIVALAIQSDGRIVVGGYFSTYAGTSRSGVLRILSNGGLDTTFVPPAVANVSSLLLQEDGRVVVRGSFMSAGVPATAFLARLNTDGATDTSFGSGGFTTSSQTPTGMAMDDGGQLFMQSNGATGLSATASAALPAISTQPITQGVAPGGTVTLSVVAGSSLPLTYQWMFNGTALVGATDASLTLANVQVSQGGNYTVAVGNELGTTTSAAAVLTVGLTRGILDGSVRANAGAGAAGLSGAFSVEGPAAKQMLIRAVGPSLTAFGVSGVLADPAIEIVNATTGAVVATNDDWGSAANAGQVPAATAAAGAFALASGSKDAVVLASFAPGTYRVRITGANASTGNALLEIYEADALNRLVYLATRGAAGPGSALLVQGVVFNAPSAGRSYLIRALGPSLGLAGALADPQLTIYDSNAQTMLGSNDNWAGASNLVALASATGAMPLAASSKDAAIAFTPPAAGAYTVRVSGVGDTSGIALVEIFESDADRAAQFAPAIVSPPQSLAADVGSAVSLGVVAIGKPAPTYQWRRNGTAISGATQSSYALASVQTSDAGNYDVLVTNSAGTAMTSAVTLTVNPTTPVIITHPASQTGVLGGNVTFSVTANGAAPLAYAWQKDGVAVPGATTANYTIANAQTTDNGSYAVMVSNSYGSVVSNSASLSVVPAGVAATQAVVGAGYLSGGTVTITNTLTYPGAPGSLGWQVTLPDGWSYASGAGAEGDVKPVVGTTGLLEWAWTTVPAGPVTFTYTVNVPAAETADRSLVATGIVRIGGTPYQLRALPDPLLVRAANHHSADTSHDYRISLLELTRVIEIYNTRNGTTRTGCYAVATTTTEDGFAPEPTRGSSTAVTLGRYHSADSNRDGKLSLLELTRVIELYNYRSGTTRTGQYHVQAGTEDGFAAGP